MNVYDNWEREHLQYPIDIMDMALLFEQDRPTLGGGDTETTGIHIIKDKPFLIVFGWYIPGTEQGRVFTFHPTPKNMKVFFNLAKRLKAFVWWNTKFDLHMNTNIGWEYTGNNLVEGMALARVCVEAIPARNGGDSLALKAIGAKYVDGRANMAEKRIHELKKKLKDEKTKVLASALRQFPLVIKGEQQHTETGRVQYWGKKAVEDFLKDITNTIDDLPEEVREVWDDWNQEYGGSEITYLDIYNRFPDEMIHYAQDDVITMMVFAKKAYLTAHARNQMDTIKRESRVILPLYRMERAGLKADRDYLFASKERVRNYILKKRKELYRLAREFVTCNQHDRIKQIFAERWGLKLEASDAAMMKVLIANKLVTKNMISGEEVKIEVPKEAQRFAELVKMLRTYEKWYSTYILKILKNTEYDGRFYTQISQCSAVSGRVGSDSQQFPKKGLYTEEGEELFHPRKAFLNDDDCSWYLLDFSQIELRNQANYTLLVSGGDLKMCRAYMPFKCHRNVRYGKDKDDVYYVEYDYSDPVKRAEWDQYTWYLNENPMIKWEKTDVHSETTHNALVLLGYWFKEKYEYYEYRGEGKPFFKPIIDEKEFEVVRSKGKTFNFMKNYGGGLGAAMKQLDLPKEVAQALIDGYEQAFPEVVTYQDKVVEQHAKQGYVTNMYGRRYYLKDNNKAYKLANYLIQGTCADMLKECIIEIDELLKDWKSRFVMTVHDELSFYIAAGEEHLVAKIKHIMETHTWHLVPLVSDVEVTTGAWVEKEKVAM